MVILGRIMQDALSQLPTMSQYMYMWYIYMYMYIPTCTLYMYMYYIAPPPSTVVYIGLHTIVCTF